MKNTEKYIVLPEQKMVVCEIYANGKRFRGTAKCSPEDEFNESIGKELAFLRAENKRKRAIIVDLREIRQSCNNMIDFWQNALSKTEKKIERQHEAIRQNSVKASKLV